MGIIKYVEYAYIKLLTDIVELIMSFFPSTLFSILLIAPYINQKMEEYFSNVYILFLILQLKIELFKDCLPEKSETILIIFSMSFL